MTLVRSGMQDSLQDELKAFEKELSILLVRFMKICDRVDATHQASPRAPAKPAPVSAAPQPPAPKPVDLRAYV